ncbi:predicted protein, partial [Haematococcus lacustris]
MRLVECLMSWHNDEYTSTQKRTPHDDRVGLDDAQNAGTELRGAEESGSALSAAQRAQEIANVDPKVAFYCRMYAVDQALQLEKRHKDINGLVASTLASLEKSKLTLTLDQESDRYHCESFALKIFSNADRTDRAGRADVNTAKAFFAASFFLE